MSEDRMAYGNEVQVWEKDSQELRDLIEKAGMNQVSAAAALGFTDRAMRGYVSGRQEVPCVVLYAMRYVAEHMPNQVRWLQVHWKKAGREVKPSDRFEIRAVNGDMQFLVNGEVAIRGHLEDLVEKGLVSVHTTQSNDRFLWAP
jgi:hypothetical protein